MIRLEERRSEMQAASIFSSVAPHYDFLNHFLSLGRDKYWRRFAVAQAEIKEGDKVLDVCSGTGDLAVEASKYLIVSGKVVALDICEEMLLLGEKKIEKLGLSRKVEFAKGDAKTLPFPDECFDAVLVGFGVRNVGSYLEVFREMYRVLKSGKRAVCLEFSHPQHPIFNRIYFNYLMKIVPRIGRLFTGTDSYYYLSQSIRNFLKADELKDIMLQAGFRKVNYFLLTGGIVAVHVGVK